MDTQSRLAVAALCMASAASRDAEIATLRQQVQDTQRRLDRYMSQPHPQIHALTAKLTACVMRLERYRLPVPLSINTSDLADDLVSESSDHESNVAYDPQLDMPMG
jgi:hypothetical protein